MEFTGERYVPDNFDDNAELSVEHLHRYHSVLALVKDKKVLDIACGEGYGSALMTAHAKEVIGIDINSECIVYAAGRYNTTNYPNLTFLEGNVEHIALPDASVDVVISFETIEHVGEAAQVRFIEEVKRVLTPGGILVVSTPDKENYTERYEHQNDFHEHELTRDEFRSLLSSRFKEVEFFEQGFEIISAISPGVLGETESIRVINWQKNPVPKKRKYLIAVTSDEPLQPHVISSVVMDTDKEYFKQVDRIVELQHEVEKLGKWGQELDRGRIEAETQIRLLSEKLQFFEGQQLQDLVAKVSQLQEWLAVQSKEKETQIQRLEEAADADKKKITSLAAELRALAAKKEDSPAKDKLIQDIQFNATLLKHQLDEANNKLLTIYDSDGWKWLRRYYNLKGKYLNENSAHYKLLRKSLNFLRGRKTVHASPSDYQTNKAVETEEEFIVTKSVIPPFDQPMVSVIIPVYNAWRMNVKCLRAILSHTSDVSYEIIIADDCSTDETRNIASYFENIIHVRNDKNLGFLLNCNNAAKYARGKYIHFLNNDTEPRAGWLSSLVMVMEKNPLAGMAGSKLVYPDGRLQEAGGIIWKDASGWNFGHHQNPEAPQFNYVKEVDYISGASIMIRAELWKELGGFDVQYSPAYCEDSDIAFAIREKGYKVLYQPMSVVVHYEGYSHGSDTEKSAISNTKEYQVINNRKFYEKWKTVLERDHFPNGEHVFAARDRSGSKKTLLMIDHYVPQFDKDAGSRTTFQYLELFVKLGFNVKFIGENFYKDEPYTTILQQMGIEVLYGEWYASNWKQWFLDNKDAFDYIYLNRPHISINFIDFFRANSNASIIYYGHDLHFLRKEKRYALEKDPKLLTLAAKWKETEMYLFSKSDIILTPSVDEQKIIQSLNPDFNVQLMRPYIYKSVSEPADDFDARKNIFFVGGFSHAPNTDGILWFVKEVWPAIKQHLQDVKFIIAGSNPPPEIRYLSTDPDI
ncbi:MAG: glycosyltransferase, partial [Chitinophagaceae bacterium]